MKFTKIISPFLAWSRVARKADTIPYPATKNPGSNRYRGFHTNDLEKCIGCGRCGEICQNEAIGMVPVEGDLPEKGDSGLRPLVDYGRCCWCALCVDVCSTGSLSMSNSYSWSTSNPDGCAYVPGSDRKAWDGSEKGYRQDNSTLYWAGSKRVEMPVRDPAERVRGFEEVVRGYSSEQAVAEASRCIQCGLCVTACPVRMHIPDYISAIARGEPEEAVRLFLDNNPLPEMCGRVCTRQCETVCAMGYQGESIAIRWLKRFACEAVSSLSDALEVEAASPGSGRGSVAIIGSGPAGLSAAYHLARLGFEVHVFEKNGSAVGVARHAIPEYRLPEEGYRRQMEVFHQLGIHFHFNSPAGPAEVNELSGKHDAVFLAPGLQTSSEFRIPGIGLPGVQHALYFLMDDPEKGGIPVGRRVLVIGGGNVAMDTARTCRRLGSDVVISYRRRIRDMPADEEEIREALEEGVEIRDRTIPERIEKTDDGLRYIYIEAEMREVPGESRPKPVRKNDLEHDIPADSIFLAVGQSSDLSLLPEEMAENIDVEWGIIKVDRRQYTGFGNIYAGGDVTPGPSDVISAIADGMRFAAAVSGKNPVK